MPKTRPAVPLFVTFTACEALVVFTACAAKEIVVGESAVIGPAAVAVPDSETDCGVVGASSLSCNVTLRGPALPVGANVTVNWQ